MRRIQKGDNGMQRLGPGEDHPQEGATEISRRTLLRVGAEAGLAFGLAAMFPFDSAWAARRKELPMSILNRNTGESVKTIFWANGKFVPDALTDINHVLRDHRTDEVHTIDPRLLVLLFRIRVLVRSNHVVDVVSGYRSPKTNAQLRRVSKRVAKRSYHTKGKALDIIIPGVPLKTVRAAAVKLHVGGVGYYPSSGFVHIDTGPVRKW